MTPRIDYRQFGQEALQAMLALEKYLSGCGFDHKFMHLLKLRASQINGCAYCIDMHAIDARAAGETEQRGGRRRSSTTASAPRSPGSRR